jgi:hypothetical protein
VNFFSGEIFATPFWIQVRFHAQCLLFIKHFSVEIEKGINDFLPVCRFFRIFRVNIYMFAFLPLFMMIQYSGFFYL